RRGLAVREDPLAADPRGLAEVRVTDLDLAHGADGLAPPHLDQLERDLVGHVALQVLDGRADRELDRDHLLEVAQIGVRLVQGERCGPPRDREAPARRERICPTGGPAGRKATAPHPSPSSLITRTWRSTNRSADSSARIWRPSPRSHPGVASRE